MYRYAEDISKMKEKQKDIYKISGSNTGNNPNEFYMEFNIDLLKLLIENGADINAKDKDGNIPISIAIIQSNNEAIDYLLSKNTSVNTIKSKIIIKFVCNSANPHFVMNWISC